MPLAGSLQLPLPVAMPRMNTQLQRFSREVSTSSVVFNEATANTRTFQCPRHMVSMNHMGCCTAVDWQVLVGRQQPSMWVVRLAMLTCPRACVPVEDRQLTPGPGSLVSLLLELSTHCVSCSYRTLRNHISKKAVTRRHGMAISCVCSYCMNGKDASIRHALTP